MGKIDTALEITNTVLGWFRSSPYKAIVTVLILSGSFLLFFGHSLDKTKLVGLATVFRLVAWTLFAFCAVWLLVALLELAIRYGWKAIEWRHYLESLTPGEKEIFKVFVSQNVTTCTFLATQLAAPSLATKGFLVPVQPSFDRMKDSGFLPYEIKGKILKHLKKHPQLLG